jgi:hypothetical protein
VDSFIDKTKSEQKKEAAKQKMQEAADAILSKWGAKKRYNA